MFREISSMSRPQLGMGELSGWEIGGLVVVLVFAGVLVWIMPELIRYVKISRM